MPVCALQDSNSREEIGVIRAVVWTVASLSAANPASSLRQAPRVLQRREPHAVRMECAGECPSNSDRLGNVAKLLNGIHASSTSTAQWMIGTAGPYTEAWL